MPLWHGIAQYARTSGLRYLVGRSSFNTRDPENGWSIYQQLMGFLAVPSSFTRPSPGFELPEASCESAVEIKVRGC